MSLRGPISDSSRRAPAFAWLLAGSALFAQTPASLPAWLEVYPGATAKTQATSGLLESTYSTPAKPAEVIAHYRKLFQAAGLSFQPGYDGMGTVIRGTAPEGDLLIAIRQQGSQTAVRVDLTAKSALFTSTAQSVAPSSPPRSAYLKNAAQIEAYNQQRSEEIEEKKRRGVENMEKYDKPVYPGQRPKPAEPVWPTWLVQVDGAPLDIVKGADFVGLKTLSATFATYSDRNTIQEFYAALLTANGFQIRQQSGPTWPRTSKAWIEAADRPPGEGPYTAIRLEIGPYGDASKVDIKITAKP